jgi:hypothetical protein
MPRELSVFGLLIPTILPLFVASLLLQAVLDTVLGHIGAYRRLWHPALARFCLLACIFGGLTITFYR